MARVAIKYTTTELGDFMMSLQIIDHPLVQHKLTILRNKNTGVKEFREIISEISMLMCYEVTRNLKTEEIEIETPVAKTVSSVLSGNKLAIMPILRAGLGMVDGMINLIPSAKVAHIGIYRDPDSLQPIQYYYKIPKNIAQRDVIVLDPMLATGGTVVSAIQHLKDSGAKSIKFLCILAAPPGVEKMQAAHPDVDIVTCCVDPQLNDHAYIVPGLGDAGDRMFGTD
jgi:uracil phosphoribosyltransferase